MGSDIVACVRGERSHQRRRAARFARARATLPPRCACAYAQERAHESGADGRIQGSIGETLPCSPVRKPEQGDRRYVGESCLRASVAGRTGHRSLRPPSRKRPACRRLFMGVQKETEDPFVNEREVSLTVSHTFSGNPDRFQIGPIKIEPDEGWKREMGGGYRTSVTAITWPGLLRYGYPLRPQRNGP